MNTNALVPLAITSAALFALFKFGGSYGKGAALGVAGLMLVNQIPMVRDGVNVRLLADAPAAA